MSEGIAREITMEEGRTPEMKTEMKKRVRVMDQLDPTESTVRLLLVYCHLKIWDEWLLRVQAV